MSIYSYPAIFHKEENGQYSIHFPDLPDVFTGADSLEEGFEMAEDALALMLSSYEMEHKPFAKPSPFEGIKYDASNEFVTCIKADTLPYLRRFSNAAIRKSVTVPEWLNDMAVEKHLSFSKILQQGLKQALGVE